MMAKPAIDGRRRRTGQSAEVQVIVVVAGLDVEAGQSQRRAGRVGRRDYPHRPRMTVRELRTHLHQQEARRHAETHHVAKAVQLGAEIARHAGKPGDVTVEAVKNHGHERSDTR